METLYDVIVIGGGPAGLSAALLLGRSLRKVLVIDAGKPRNQRSHAMHGFLSREGTNPLDFLRISREQLAAYSNIHFISEEVYRASAFENKTFEIADGTGKRYYSKRLLIATGLVDDLPEIKGIERLYGQSVFHCPYCDGWEVRLKPLAAYGKGKSGVGLAISLTNWSDDVMLFSDGKKLTEEEHRMIRIKNILLCEEKIVELEGKSGMLEKIILESGEVKYRNALFFTTDQYQCSNIAAQLGCKFTRKGVVETDQFQQTNIPGVYVAGDAARDMQLVIIAAAEGAKAGVIINQSLQKEGFELKQPQLIKY